MFRSGSVARLRQALTVALVAGFVLADAAVARNASPTPAPDDPDVAVRTGPRDAAKFSAAEIAAPTFTPRSAPAAPAIGAVHAGDEALTVVWAAPPGVADITAYDVRYVLTSADGTVDSNWTVAEDAWTGGPLHHVLTGLTNDAGYDVQVRAVTDTDGAWSATVAGTPAEFGASRPTAASLPLDVPLGGVIGTPSDNDLFRLTLPRKAGLLLFTRGSLDTDGALYNSDGEALAVNYDEVELEELNFLIARVLDAGTYYLDVEGWGRGTGPYTVHAEMIVDTTGIDDAQAVAVGGVAKGLIDKSGDADYFRFTLDAQTDVLLRSGPRVADTAAELLDGNGAPVTANDDGFVLGDPQRFLIRRKLAAGTYYVKVKPHLKDGTRHYSFHVETVTEPGSAIADALPLAFGQLAAGRIDPSTDADYFRIDLAAATHVLARAVSNTVDIDGALLDGNGAAVGANVFEHTYGAEGPLGFMLSDRLAAGAHTLRVTRSAGDSAGGYAIRMLEDEAMNELVADCSALTAPFGDPLSGCQWHLKNTGQLGGWSGEDIRVEDVWAGGNLGAGIGVAVVDSGLDEAHPDLAGNVDAARGHDYTDGDGLLYHGEERSGRRHAHGDPGGTAAAGVIAARDNGLGGRGVAPRATVYGYNLLRDRSAANEADAMTRGMATTAVSNNSWGPRDTPGLDPAPAAWETAVDSGVTSGYGGKGVVYVWAAGNGGPLDESNFDGYANYYGVVAVCAVDHRGRRSTVSERGANLWVCAPSGDFYRGGPGILTTYDYGRYGNDFGGTSAAAPTVAGVVALVRAANPALTWRDVKLILAASARRNHSSDRDWRTGASKYGAAGRYRFNRQYGFGVVDAKAAVDLADGWENLPPFIEPEPVEVAPNLIVPDATVNVNGISSPGTTVESTVEIGTEVEFVEFVEVVTDFDARAFRDLEVELVSPSSTVSTLAVPYAGLGDDLAPFGIDPGLPVRFGAASRRGPRRHLDAAGHRPRGRGHRDAELVEPEDLRPPFDPGGAARPGRDAGAERPDRLLAAAHDRRRRAGHVLRRAHHPERRRGQVGRPLDGGDGRRHGGRPALHRDRSAGRSGIRRAGPRRERAGRGRLVGVGDRHDAGERGAGVQLSAGLRRGGEPDLGRHGAGVGQRRRRRRDRLRDRRRGGCGVLLDRGDERGADVRRGAELRGTEGHGREQHLRGRGPGHERHGAASEDGDAGDHGGGGRCGRRGAGQAGCAERVGGVGDEPERDWSAPDNAGPAITDYDYRHRTASPRGAWTEVTGTTITTLSATIASLAENTSYDVQVRATNGDGPGAWSASGSGATHANPLNGSPVLDAAMVKGTELELRFDRRLDERSVPAPADFAVVTGAGGGSTLTVTEVEVRDTSVVLTLEQEVQHGARVTVSYTPGTTPLQDEHGTAVPAIGNETAVETALSVAAARAVEGADVPFVVTLSPAVASAVTVDWFLTPGSAAPDTDYTGPLAGSLTIGAGRAAGAIAVPTAEDTLVEGDETFTLTLTEPAGFPHWALLDTATATGTIVDDDFDTGGTSGGGSTGGGSGSGGGTSGGGSGGSRDRPPVATDEIGTQVLERGASVTLDASQHFRDPERRTLTFTAASADPAVATVTVDGAAVTITGLDHGHTRVTLTATDRRRQQATQEFEVRVGRTVSFADAALSAPEGGT